MVRLEKFKIAQVPTVAYQPKGMLKQLRFMIGPTAWELRPFQPYLAILNIWGNLKCPNWKNNTTFL